VWLALRPGTASAQTPLERKLFWRELSVTARLDARGELHVSERHQMVFTGDWNGGERSFSVRGDQSLELEGVTRVTSDGTRVPLVEGDLSSVDEYAWTEESVLRWRSRLPNAPPFAQTDIGYVLEYRLADVLLDLGASQFTLDHEFAFQFRPGDVEKFQLHLTLDPVWISERPSPIEVDAGPLKPSEGFALTLPLEYSGGELPKAGLWERLQRRSMRPPLIRMALAAAFLVLIAGSLVQLLRYLRRLGHFAKLPPVTAVDEAFISKHLLPVRPEVVAYLRDVGSAKLAVAALLARLANERKIETLIQEGHAHGHRGDLELALLVPREQFSGYERRLIDQLFFEGDRTSTEAIAAHYHETGFDPAYELSSPLMKELVPLLGESYDVKLWRTGVRIVATFGSIILLNLALFRVQAQPAGNGAWPAQYTAFGSVGYFVFGAVLARRVLSNYTNPVRAAVWFALGIALEAVGVVALILGASGLSPWGSLVIALIGLVVMRTVLGAARTHDHAAGTALRKNLEAVRRYFVVQLTKAEPALEKTWYPYLVAFGLGEEFDRRLTGFAAEGSARTRSRPAASLTSGNSGASGSNSAGLEWAGSGGRFGGGGASGSWTSAATALAAGVTKPNASSGSPSGSRSSSSRGSSGGGSRSGGGGGGGW
jgi:uncharacterized membrane protein YgcG